MRPVKFSAGRSPSQAIGRVAPAAIQHRMDAAAAEPCPTGPGSPTRGGRPQAGGPQESGMAQQGTGTTLVTVVSTGQTFACPPGELILDAGLEAGIGLPHNCRGGACGTCKSQILEGEVDHGWVMSFAISEEEKAAG